MQGHHFPKRIHIGLGAAADEDDNNNNFRGRSERQSNRSSIHPTNDLVYGNMLEYAYLSETVETHRRSPANDFRVTPSNT